MSYFTIKELCASATAEKLGIDNTPSAEIIEKLQILIDEVLNPLRARCGFPIYVTSGYRCDKLNKKVGGAKNSQHLRGEAVDLVGIPGERTKMIFEHAKSLGKFDQLLYEKNKKGDVWVHLSYKKNNNRKQCIDNYLAK